MRVPFIRIHYSERILETCFGHPKRVPENLSQTRSCLLRTRGVSVICCPIGVVTCTESVCVCVRVCVYVCVRERERKREREREREREYVECACVARK